MRAFFESDLQLKERKVGKLTARVMWSGKPISTHRMIRGDFRRPGMAVKAAFPRIVDPSVTQLTDPPATATTSRRRAALAHWLTKADHPLTARVIVNRLWQSHFGHGLTRTPSDFGLVGQPPSHPQLLDYLATELVRCQWSLKQLHYLIVVNL